MMRLYNFFFYTAAQFSKLTIISALLIATAGCETDLTNGYLWNKDNLSVCWNKNVTASTSSKEYLQDIVDKEWDVHIRLNFEGWNSCDNTTSPDIVIQASSYEELNIDGTNYAGRADVGMPLDLPNNIYLDFDSCASPENNDVCYQRLLLHEFGHVLNLRHEQSRLDTPAWCTNMLIEAGYEEQAGKVEQYLVGPWSIDSIMNYCGNSIVPDKWDVIEVQENYPI